VGSGVELKAELVVSECRSKRQWYAYDVLLEGKAIVSGARDPETDLARALLALGRVGFVSLVDAQTGKLRSRVNIEKAARLVTIEGPHGPFWRRQTQTDRTYTAEPRLRASEQGADAPSWAEALSVE